MSAQENIINKIVDLDKKAEGIVVKATEEAKKISEDSLKRINEEKESVLKQIEKKKDEINSKEALACDVEVKKVRDEYARSVESVNQIPAEKIDKVVKYVISNFKGNSK